jgi:hypothetical protein
MRDTEETGVTSRYSSWREYRGQSTLSFTDARVRNAIDTERAAAGDVIIAKVLKPVRDNRSKETLIPAGATVQGRIIVMKRWLAAPAFHIAILLAALEVDGASSPIYVKLDRTDELRNTPRSNSGLLQRGTTIILPPIGHPRALARSSSGPIRAGTLLRPIMNPTG